MRKYGTDKPDLRNPIEMQDVSEHFRGGGFKACSPHPGDAKNAVWAIPAPKGGSRAFCDRMNSWAQGEGQPGLGYIFWREGGLGRPDRQEPRPGAHRRPDPTQLGLGRRCRLLRRRRSRRFYKFAGLGPHQGRHELNLVDEDQFKLLDRRLPDVRVERGREEGRLLAQPVLDAAGRLDALETQDPLTILAYQYDIVCNGYELCSGAIRNHKPEIMLKAFEIAGYGSVVEEQFGGMYRAFRMARRRTAVWRPASTASSCCWPARRPSARSSPSR
jgi:aspartyl-tRNA synthetase